MSMEDEAAAFDPDKPVSNDETGALEIEVLGQGLVNTTAPIVAEENLAVPSIGISETAGVRVSARIREDSTFSSNDDEDDEDNWSSIVQADDENTNAAALLFSPTGHNTGTVGDAVPLEAPLLDATATPSSLLGPPSRPELSLKEKLVVRERQRRIETERARLKRQFALMTTTNTIVVFTMKWRRKNQLVLRPLSLDPIPSI
jgi:hypothetical protein